MGNRYSIISADSHVNIPETAFAQYFPPKLRDRAPKVEHGEEQDTIVFEGQRSKISLLSAVAGRKYEDFKLNATRIGEGAIGGYDPVERLKDMDLDGVHAEVLFGTVGGGFLNQTNDPELKLTLTQAYNDWLADYCKTAPDRLIGMAEMPYWNLDQTLAEAKRAREKGLKGIVMHAIPADHNYTEPLWEPLWNLLEEQEMPIHWHLGMRPLTPGLASQLMISISCNKSMMAEPITSVIFSGVLERHPKLNVVSVEGGIGWSAFLVGWMDNVYERHRHWTGNQLKELPSSYFHNQVKLTFIEDEVGVRERHTIGLNAIMWSNDYPHSDSTWPHSQEVIAKHFAGVPEHETAQMVSGNAAKLYGLKAVVPA